MRRVLLVTFLLMAVSSIAFAQDPVKVDPKHYTVMLDNEQVRVLKIQYGAKEKSVMHEHPGSVVVFVTNSNVQFTLPDGSKVKGGGKAGDVQFADAGKHMPQNMGAAAMQGVLVELKGGPAGSAKVTLDPVKVDPTRHKVVFENDRVRVLRVKFKAHDKTKEHEHPNGVAIYLTDVKAKFTLADGKTREGGGKRGEITWAAAEKHSVQNMTAKPADIILVELK